MSCNNNARTCFCTCQYCRRSWSAKVFDVSIIEHFHYLKVHLSCFEDKLHIPTHIEIYICQRRKESLMHKRINFGIAFAHFFGVISIGGYALETENKNILKTLNVGVLAAHTRLCTTLPTCRLFTLITKHKYSFQNFS